MSTRSDTTTFSAVVMPPMEKMLGSSKNAAYTSSEQRTLMGRSLIFWIISSGTHVPSINLTPQMCELNPMAPEFIPQSTVMPQLAPQTQPIDLTATNLLSNASTPTCGFGAECPFLGRQGALQSHLNGNQHAPTEKRSAEKSHTMYAPDDSAKRKNTKRSRTTTSGPVSYTHLTLPTKRIV